MSKKPIKSISASAQPSALDNFYLTFDREAFTVAED